MKINDAKHLALRDMAASRKEKIDQGVLVRKLQHWSEFTDLIRKQHANCPAYIYRGQSYDWPLLSRLDRLESKFPTKPNYDGGVPDLFDCSPADRDTQLAAFKEAARGRVAELVPDASDDEWWTLAAHHGLATPFLDWTYYAFAALFFAFEEECVCIDGSYVCPEKRIVYRVSWHLLEERVKEADDAPYAFVPKLASSPRFISQRAISVKMPKGVDLEAYVRDKFADDNSDTAPYARAILEKICLPNDDRRACLKFLNKMGMNRLTLFPDLDGAAAYINALWQIDFDSSIGQIRRRHDRT